MTHYIETLFHFRLIQMCECVVGNVNAAVMQYVLSVHLSMIDVHTEIFLGEAGFLRCGYCRCVNQDRI